MKIDLFAIAWNEEKRVQAFLDWYTPICDSITIFDNNGTDRTAAILIDNGCRVIQWGRNEPNNFDLRDLKNTCWKSSHADWVIVCDIDELLWHREGTREALARTDATIIKPRGYQMVSETVRPYPEIRTGATDKGEYSKTICFRPTAITEINFGIGAHKSSPQGDVRFSRDEFSLFHMCYIGRQAFIERYKRYAAHMSVVDKVNGFGGQYLSSEERLNEKFDDLLRRADVVW